MKKICSRPGPRVMRRLAALVPALLVLNLACPAEAGTINGETTGKYGYTLVLGESVAVTAMWRLHELRPSWVIDALNGRNVGATLDLIKYWTKKKGRTPRQIVVALGTNTHPDWRPWHYRKIRPLLPNTKIVFVTPIRTAANYFGAEGEYWTARNAAGMEEAAATQRAVCIADWRAAVEEDPEMVFDGTHPVKPARAVWAHLVSAAMQDCGT